MVSGVRQFAAAAVRGFAIMVVVATLYSCCGEAVKPATQTVAATLASKSDVFVAAISFTGPECDGVPTFDHWHDLNGNGEWDIGEPPGAWLIEAPEWTVAGRNRPGFFKVGMPGSMRVRLTVVVPDASSVTCSALCTEYPEINLRQVEAFERVAGTNDWEGIVQLQTPINDIRAFEKFTWDWTVSV